MKKFSELFKKYRLRSEFATFASFSNALAEKGYFYEESIFSHWQKGTRVPTERRLVLAIIEIFVEKRAITTTGEANEILEATGSGNLTQQETEKLAIKIQKSFKPSISRFTLVISAVLTFLFVGALVLAYFYLNPLLQKNYVNIPRTVPSAVTEPKKLVVGIDATLEPMEFIENGKIVGFDVDLGNILADEIGADIEFRNIPFDNLFNSLDQRQINVIISAVTITEERENKYDFSEPYLNAGQVIITKKGNTTIRQVSDLKGKKISTQTGTTNEQEAVKHTADKLVIRYSNFVQATQALVNGEVDALFTDLPNAKGIISKYPDLQVVGEPFTKEYYGIVFLKGDPSVTQINEALDSLRKKGVLAELEKKWLK